MHVSRKSTRTLRTSRAESLGETCSENDTVRWGGLKDGAKIVIADADAWAPRKETFLSGAPLVHTRQDGNYFDRWRRLLGKRNASDGI